MGAAEVAPLPQGESKPVGLFMLQSFPLGTDSSEFPAETSFLIHSFFHCPTLFLSPIRIQGSKTIKLTILNVTDYYNLHVCGKLPFTVLCFMTICFHQLKYKIRYYFLDYYYALGTGISTYILSHLLKQSCGRYYYHKLKY